MKVPNNILKKWELLRSQGDVKILSEALNLSKPTIAKALKNGECSPENFEAIKKFYDERKKMITA